MRKNLFLLTMASALLTLSSCKKVWDYVKDHPNGTADNCRIDKIYFTEYYDYISDNLIPTTVLFDDTANFKYNSSGQLIAISYASSFFLNKEGIPFLSTPFPQKNYNFVYDKQGRLAAYLEQSREYNDSIVWGATMHKYTYIGNNLVIDSTFQSTDAPGWTITKNNDINFYIPAESGRDVTIITLDNIGRVIKAGNTTYTYDAAGNLEKPGITYTNKKNIFQTNKSLMFVNRDYSINATSGFATQYNSNQLPTRINSGNLQFITFNFFQYGKQYDEQNIRVEYQCK